MPVYVEEGRISDSRSRLVNGPDRHEHDHVFNHEQGLIG
jgi:hypothetical protein